MGMSIEVIFTFSLSPYSDLTSHVFEVMFACESGPFLAAVIFMGLQCVKRFGL